jgi:hypothetical protein
MTAAEGCGEVRDTGGTNMDYITTTTTSGVTIIEDADGKIATLEQGERATRLKEFLPELAAIVTTPCIAIALDRFLKLHAAEFLLQNNDSARALSQIADCIQYGPAEIGEPLTREGEAEISIIRKAAKDIDRLNGVSIGAYGAWCPRCGRCNCGECTGCVCNRDN